MDIGYKSFVVFDDKRFSDWSYEDATFEFASIIWSAPGFFNATDVQFISEDYYAISASTEATPSPIDAINWGSVITGASDSGTLVINYRFQPFEKDFVSIGGIKYDARQWLDYEMQQMRIVMDVIETFIDVIFVEVQDAGQAIFNLSVFQSTFLPVAGIMMPPGEENAGQAAFNRWPALWGQDGEGGLEQGGFGFEVILHELGHGLGLAHPHDIGGTSTVMSGVESSSDTGDFGLNQGVFTVMSYVDAWPEGPNGESASNAYGWSGTYSPLDIAHLQSLYGANQDTGSGDTTYILDDQNAAGTFYQAIWDVDGNDTLQSDSVIGAVIDLRTATLQYEEGGGGFVSYNSGVIGGFTIANGVVIENAIGGSGSDTITGNDAGNILNGRDGADFIFGGAGNDTLIGGKGNDELSGEAGSDHFIFEGAHGDDRILDFQIGVDFIELESNAYNLATLKVYQNGNDVVIISDGGTVTLVGINIAALSDADFVFRLVPETAPGTVANGKPNVSEVNSTIVEKPAVSEVDGFVFSEKAAIEGDSTYLSDEYIIDQDVYVAFLEAVQSIHHEFVARESLLEPGYNTDGDLLHFADFYNFA